MEEIVNKVAKSKLITIDIEDYYNHAEKATYDLADQLFQGLILREKDFRDHVKNHDWEAYEGKNVAITCSADAIVPTWAYMLVSASLSPYAKEMYFGNEEDLDKQLLLANINKINVEEYKDAKIVVKGCGELNIGPYAYVELTKMLQPYCSSIMFGEPCSTVPVYKKRRQKI